MKRPLIALLLVGALVAALPASEPLLPKAAAKSHWAFQPVKRPAVLAETNHASGSSPAIDALIVRQLNERGLQLSPEADRRTLIRRLYFNLVGLPPSPEQVAAFIQSDDPEAYGKLIETLLASPRYGERWARHWLDGVRFAESHGFEMNQPRANAWPYRDYVIRAFNEDAPYDRFVMEQLVGDVLGVDEATGFLVAGALDEVKSPDPVLTANQRADELHDIVSTTSSAFLGLTVGCARCHNHKFDPIPQADYFAVKAVFEGVRHGERPWRAKETALREKELMTGRRRLAEVEYELDQHQPLAHLSRADTNALRPAVNPRRNIDRFSPVNARWLRFTIAKTTDAEPCLDELEVFTAGTNARNVALAEHGTTARASSVYPNSDIHRLEHLNDGKFGNGRSWISNERGQGWVELEFPEERRIDKVVWGRDREQRFSDRLATEYRIEVAVRSNDWTTIATSADRQRYSGGKATNLLAVTDPAVPRLLEERAELESRVARLARSPMIYGGTFNSNPAPTHRWFRGDPMLQREEVPPGALRMVAVTFPPADAADAVTETKLTEDQRRRVALGRWIVDPANPLTARVMVNRIWHYHFGEGLVSTASDFGLNGARPTHPELLDWLAAEFVGHGWSIKHLHRLILNSATFRQASVARDDGLRVDADSRLLWRFPPRRMEAEPIRDTILSVSGTLDLRMGGPGFSFFEPNDNYVRVYAPRSEWAPDTLRRMIYGTVIRQRTDGVFGAFDCPDAGQIAPRRGRSTTPLQALNLLNSSFIMQQAEFFAKRLEKESGDDVNARVNRAFALAFQREADPAELAAAKTLVHEAGLNIFCRALLNASEFIYLE